MTGDGAPILDDDPVSAEILKESGHVGFGMGVHQCVGQHVARLARSS